MKKLNLYETSGGILLWMNYTNNGDPAYISIQYGQKRMHFNVGNGSAEEVSEAINKLLNDPQN